MASNLLGAMTGGLVEYFSMITGFRNLLLLAAAFYFFARLTMSRKPDVLEKETTNEPSVGADASGSTPLVAS
jgi:hypothetical protein